MIKKIIFMMLFPSSLFAQLFFEIEQTQFVSLKHNVELTEMLIGSINSIKKFDGKEKITIPIAVKLDKGKYVLYKNHLCSYGYDNKMDKVSYKGNDALVVEIDFKNKVVKKSYVNGTSDDHYKPSDLEAVIKKKEKQKKR